MKSLIRKIGIIFLVVLMYACKKDDEQNNYAVMDVDDNGYHAIVIGSQTWMVENLKTTKYNDNSSIPLVTDNTAWNNLSSPGFCWPDNNAASSNASLGALYNWYTVETQKICPVGWHVPSRADYITLENYLGGPSVAGGKMKEVGTIHWANPNTGATNESGFTGLPGSFRYENGIFESSKLYCAYWTSSVFMDHAYYVSLVYSSSFSTSDVGADKRRGQYIRCIKD